MKIEIELTSACNAVCSECKRTKMNKAQEPFPLAHTSFSDIEQYFDSMDLTGARIKLCGVLGDPIACKDLFDITEFFVLKKVRFIELSTNGGLKTTDWWRRFGEMSAWSEGVLDVQFAIDGVWDNDYREGVDLEKVWNNVNAYIDAGGKAGWQYIMFDYNEDQYPVARDIAKRKGMKLYKRTAWKNVTSKREKLMTERFARDRIYV